MARYNFVPPTGFEPAFDIISIPLYDSRFEDGANTEAFILKFIWVM